MTAAPLRLRLDHSALVANWRWLARMSGVAACGAAVKADGYGLGAGEVVRRLAEAGCRDFFVATWAEAAALMPWADGLSLSVLHGVREDDLRDALASPARPVLNTAAQAARWREAGGGVADAMVDTGMNRLGLSAADVRAGLLDGLALDTLMSHLACAEEDSAMNERQRGAFATLAGETSARRMSLANSAGILLGNAFAFDLTRPGLAIYGGVPRGEAVGHIRQVVFPEAQVLQVRDVCEGETVGYGATWRATRRTRVAIVNIGYADGYPRSFSNIGSARIKDHVLPVIGRVSMDLIAIQIEGPDDLAEGTWVGLDLDLLPASARSGLSQYELLTRQGARLRRRWS